MTLPTVLLVEDDASIRRFVGMALDDLAVNLVQHDSIADALGCLKAGPVDLVLTDLSLRDGSGMALVQWLAKHARCKVVVFSAGVTPLVARDIDRIGVWRVLHKPVPLAQLQACVRDGVAAVPADSVLESTPGSSFEFGGEAVQRFFGGDRGLFDRYSANCRMQFINDMKIGSDALRAGDLQTLRRLAHSLHTVLDMLGCSTDANLAQALERSAEAGRMQEASAAWAALRGALDRLSA